MNANTELQHTLIPAQIIGLRGVHYFECAAARSGNPLIGVEYGNNAAAR